MAYYTILQLQCIYIIAQAVQLDSVFPLLEVSPGSPLPFIKYGVEVTNPFYVSVRIPPLDQPSVIDIEINQLYTALENSDRAIQRRTGPVPGLCLHQFKPKFCVKSDGLGQLLAR